MSIKAIAAGSTEVKVLADGVTMGSQEQTKGIAGIVRAVRQMGQQIGHSRV